MIADPHSLAWRLERVRFLGLTVEPRGVPVCHGDAWVPDPTPWARAPARTPIASMPWTRWPALDASADSAEARVWLIDACTDSDAVLTMRSRWAEVQELESRTGADAIDRVRRLSWLVDALRPTWDEAEQTLRAMMASAGAGAAYEPLTHEQAAEVLGWTVEAVRGAVKRGDVRSVKHGTRRRIPYDEVKRLALESSGKI